MKAKKFDSMDSFDFKPGSYCFVKAEGRLGVFITLPCGHNFMPDNKWQLENPEDENKITVRPSIFCSPSKPCWHGYLTNGEFKQV